MLRNTGFLSELLQGKISLDGAGSADARASPNFGQHSSALQNTQPMTELIEQQITRGMTARTKFNRDTYASLMTSSRTPVQKPLVGYAEQKVHGVPMTYSQSVHPTVGRAGTLTRHNSKGGRTTRLRPLILQHEPTRIVDSRPLDRSFGGLSNGLGPAGKRRRLQTSPPNEPNEGDRGSDRSALEFYPTPVNKLTHDLIAAVETLLRANSKVSDGKAFILPKFVEVAQSRCVDCILLRAGGGYFRLGVPKVPTCNCFKCGMLLDFDVRTNTHLTRGKMRHKVGRQGHPHGKDDDELMARRAADWISADQLAQNEEEASRQLEELERLKMMQAMAAKESLSDQLQGWNLFKPKAGETTKEWMDRMAAWASTRHVGETEEEFRARLAKWLERQPDETDEEYAARMRAYHKRKDGETEEEYQARLAKWSERRSDETDEEYAARMLEKPNKEGGEGMATYWQRLSKLMRFDMAKLKEISSQWATIEDAEEHERRKAEAEAKRKRQEKLKAMLDEANGRNAIRDSNHFILAPSKPMKKKKIQRNWGLLQKSVVKSLPSMMETFKLFEIVKAAKELNLRDMMKKGRGQNNWNKLRMPLNTVWHAKKKTRKKLPPSEGMLNAVNCELTDIIDAAVEDAVRVAVAEVQEENAMLAVLLDDVLAEMTKNIAVSIQKTHKKKMSLRVLPKAMAGFGFGHSHSTDKKAKRQTLIAKAADAKHPRRRSMVDYLTQYTLVNDARLSLYHSIFDEYDVPKTGELNAEQLAHALAMVVDKEHTDFIDEMMGILKECCDLEEILSADFKLFTIFAALIEKIVSFESHVDLNNGVGDRPLSVGQKLQLQLRRAKNLFHMCGFNEESGTVPLSAIEHEIKSGGLKPEETESIIDALYARKLQEFTFVDFLDYVPFFNSLHAKIVAAPLVGNGMTEEERKNHVYTEELEKQKMFNPPEPYEDPNVYAKRVEGLATDALSRRESKDKAIKEKMGLTM